MLGADPAIHSGWSGPYDVDTPFHEPLVQCGYLAAITSLELVTSVLILPQRQTALVAKQAAEIDLLSNGRFRLGVGLGWNEVEYEALGMPFGRRGARLEEQVALMRRLWTERSVTHDGAFDHVTGAGIAPLPVQRPIPVWIGAKAPPALRRAGAIADGVFPMFQPGEGLDQALEQIAEGATRAGRDPADVGIHGSVLWGPGGAEDAAATATAWAAAGADQVSINTLGVGPTTVDGHLEILANATDALRGLQTVSRPSG